MFYVRKSGKIIGPFNIEKLNTMAAEGVVLPKTEISTDKTTWKKAELMPDLFPKLEEDKKPELKEQEEKQTATRREIGIAGSEKEFPDKLEIRKKIAQVVSLPEEAPVRLRAPSAIFPVPDKEERRGNILEMLWNPAEVLPEIYSGQGEKNSTMLGLVLMLASTLFFFWAIRNTGTVGQYSLQVKFPNILLVLVAPSAGMFFAIFATRYFFAREGGGSFGSDCLTSGFSFLLLSVSLVIISFLMKDMTFFHEKGVFIAAGLLLYAYTSTVLVVHAGSVRISGIPESVASVTVPLSIAICMILTAYVFKMIVMQ